MPKPSQTGKNSDRTRSGTSFETVRATEDVLPIGRPRSSALLSATTTDTTAAVEPLPPFSRPRSSAIRPVAGTIEEPPHSPVFQRRDRSQAISQIPKPSDDNTLSPILSPRQRSQAISAQTFGRQRSGAIHSFTPQVADSEVRPMRPRSTAIGPGSIVGFPQTGPPSGGFARGRGRLDKSKTPPQQTYVSQRTRQTKPITPSIAYRDYMRNKFRGKPTSQFSSYDPFGENRGPHRPVPSTYALGHSDTGYTAQHPSEEFLPQTPTGSSAVYGVENQQPIHGPAEWGGYYRNWNELGAQFQQDTMGSQGIALSDVELTPDEKDFVEKYGMFFEQQIGRGSFGTVWLCRATKLFKDTNGHYVERKVACKVLSLHRFRKNKTESIKKVVDKLTHEADIHSSLNHKNIVKCEHTFYIHDPDTGFPFCRLLMYMELCDGDLKNLLETQPNKKFDENEARLVLIDVTDALQYMHSQNVCHLDIKIHNIMYRREGTGICYKLADFGISKRYNSEQESKVYGALGTRMYMAPELQRQPPEYSESKPADIFSLGSVVIEIVTGRAKIRQVLSDLKNMGLSQEFFDKWKISPQLASLFTRMTAMEPRSRPTIDEIQYKRQYKYEDYKSV